jgi:hypothetical protein
VNRLKPIVAMLMLTLFAFESSHPLLEGLGLIHQEISHAAGSADSDTDHDTADGICRIESSQDKVQQPAFDVLDVFHSFIFTYALLSISEYDDKLGGIESSASPPGLGVTWQFISRAALPARAPSFLS